MSLISSQKLMLIVAFFIATFFAVLQTAPITPPYIKTNPTAPESTALNEPPESPKPTVAVLATGGTALGKGGSPTDTSHYISGASHIDSVIDLIRLDFQEIAHVVTHQILSTDSINFHAKELITIRNGIIEYLRRPEISGVVVVTGTTTMHIVARFIEHTIPLFNKTIALTGAIKPLTAYGADGPGHILSAIHTVATRCLNRVVILMENKIMLPRRSYKHHNTFVPGDGSLLGSVVNFRPEIFNAPRDIPKTFDIQGLEAHDKIPRTKYFHPMMEEEEFDRAIKEGVEAAVLGVYDDGYFPERLTNGLKKLTDQVGFIAAAVSYGHTFDVRRRIDGVVPASDWTDRILMMMMPFVLSSNMTWEERMEFIAEPYVKNERDSCAMVPTQVRGGAGSRCLEPVNSKIETLLY
ncbi:Glutaminase-asparaginase [Fusarium oxysporum f. sp. raphani]|uniref:Glutaminase-asparaginase n=1 Tax=Fusarium oxysporum f. sp. raphani TaxID=96318 RepID=A0A8J5ULE4_FUSOX|nr:Glutaminase-asparaginase [Fusarium oxysporum f. sp. raphani]